MCGGGGVPQDKSAEVAQINAQQAQVAREEQARKDAEARKSFEGRLGGAYTTGLDSAQQHFASQGLDPNEYMGAIQTALNSAKSRVPDLDGSPGTYFDNLGATVFDQLQEGQRSKALRGFDTFARDGFATRRITNDTDDPFLNAILEERAAEADNYTRRLLDRGVITQSGYDAAGKNIQGQRAGANARLQDIGMAELERGRGGLRDIASSGRSTASQMRLGDAFDPYQYQGDIDKAQTDFFASLANNLRANAPEDLFDTSGLAGIAGYTQGAQNTAFDPGAIAGMLGGEEEVVDDEEDDDEFAAF
jgi:hypothetical protein